MEGVLEGQFYTCQNKAWVNNEVSTDEVNRILLPFIRRIVEMTKRTASRARTSSWTSLSFISSPLRSESIFSLGTTIDYIPVGYSSKLQVLDVGINKPFTGYDCCAYEEFMVGNAMNVKPLRTIVVAEWIKDAWGRAESHSSNHHQHMSIYRISAILQWLSDLSQFLLFLEESKLIGLKLSRSFRKR